MIRNFNIASNAAIESTKLVLGAVFGKTFYVDSGHPRAGTTDRHGVREAPFSTLVSAMSQLATRGTSDGDLILVAPGHAETVSAAGGLALSRAQTYILGLGTGTTRPTITFATSTAATVTVTAANVTIDNFRFQNTSLDGLAEMVVPQAQACQILNSTFTMGSSNVIDTLVAVSATSAASNLVVRNCRFIGTADGGSVAGVQVIGGNNTLIENCTFFNAFSQGGIYNLTTAASNLGIFGNSINNIASGSTKAIVLAAGTTGQIANNRFQILSGTAPITGAGISWVGGNYYANAVATAGTLI